jgi:hypothetical protein
LNGVSVDIGRLASQVVNDDPRAGLRAVSALTRLLGQLETAYVVRLRSSGASWQEIGELIGISRQAAHKKYARSVRAEGRAGR